MFVIIECQQDLFPQCHKIAQIFVNISCEVAWLPYYKFSSMK